MSEQCIITNGKIAQTIVPNSQYQHKIPNQIDLEQQTSYWWCFTLVAISNFVEIHSWPQKPDSNRNGKKPLHRSTTYHRYNIFLFVVLSTISVHQISHIGRKNVLQQCKTIVISLPMIINKLIESPLFTFFRDLFYVSFYENPDGIPSQMWTFHFYITVDYGIYNHSMITLSQSSSWQLK